MAQKFFLVVLFSSFIEYTRSQLVNITCADPPLNTYPYCNSKLPIDQRVDDLLSRLTLWEKVFMQNSDQGGVPRLGVPTLGHSECNRGTEAIPGNINHCTAPNTSISSFPLSLFPQAINLAGFDAIVDYRDWIDTFQPAFKICAEVGTSSFMWYMFIIILV